PKSMTKSALEIAYTPEQIRELLQRDLSGHTAVVIDVLRATSTEITALANGAEAIFPAATVEEARALKEKTPSLLLAGERHGLPPEGFDLGNSPREFTAEKVKGRKIVHTTTNGTLAWLACRNAAETLGAAFLNLNAVTERLRRKGGPVLLVC